MPASPGGFPIPCPGLGSRLIPSHAGLLRDPTLLTRMLWGGLDDMVSSCSPFRAALEGFPCVLQLVRESTKLNTLSHPQLEVEEATFKTSHRHCPSRHGAVGGTPCCRTFMDKETRQAWSREIACRMVKPLKPELALVVLCW